MSDMQTSNNNKKSWRAMVEMDFFSLPGLSVYEKIVYTLLCGFADRAGECFPCAQRVAAMAGCSARQVQRATASLEARGLIVKRPRFNENGEQMSNLYLIKADFKNIAEQSSDARGLCVCDAARGKAAARSVEKILRPAATERRNGPDGASYKQNQSNIKSKESDTSYLEARRAPDGVTPLCLDGVPPAMRVTAEFFMLKTGRSELSEEERAAFAEVEKSHLPARVQREIQTAASRFEKNGRALSTLGFCYVAAALRGQKSRVPRELSTRHADAPSAYARELSRWEAASMARLTGCSAEACDVF